MRSTSSRRYAVALLSLSLAAAAALGARAESAGLGVAQTADLASLEAYIRKGWTTLTRSSADLATAAVDPKFPAPGGRALVYVSRRENLAALRERIPASQLEKIELRRLPRPGSRVDEQGLLYLPRPYVVPGGRFNEMYGWDSYFIVRGLLADGEVGRARDMVEDAIYEVLQYGKVLNANRSYYLGRSQPPLLTPMIRAVFAATHDRAWLASTLPAVRKQYAYWTKTPHLAGDTGLSRYRALGAGPAPEVVSAERDAAGKNHYDRLRLALRSEPPAFTARFYDQRHDRLTPLAYIADRTVRESGFDTTDRFGRFSLAILDYAPVCLNSLLYAMERDTAAILDEIGSVGGARKWTAAAERRAKLIRELLWDETRGLFLDHDFVDGGRPGYAYATTFFPLWVGAATPEQARRVAQSALATLLKPGGIVTSTKSTGQQWDAPFGWAPLQLVAVEGLRRYGFDREADLIAVRFLGTVLKEFVEHGTVFEKYDVERRESDVSQDLHFGYSSNEIGFGWTNGVFRALEDGLGPSGRAAITAAAANR